MTAKTEFAGRHNVFFALNQVFGQVVRHFENKISLEGKI